MSAYGRRVKKKLTGGTHTKIELAQQRVIFSWESNAEAGECPVDYTAQGSLQRKLDEH